MYLRSDLDWHLDAANEATIDAYSASRGLTRRDVEPLSLDFYRGYLGWFQEQKRIVCRAALVDRLDHDGNGFAASLVDGNKYQRRDPLG